MKKIKLLVENIEDELADARKYAELALEYKETEPEMAGLFYRLSGEEMTHQNALHNEVVREISEYKRSHGEAPAAMTAVYDYLHKRFIAQAECVERLQNLFSR